MQVVDLVPLEKEANHLWWLGTELTKAQAASDRVALEDTVEAIVCLAEISEHPSIRTKARGLLASARLIGPPDLVAFKTAETVVQAVAAAAD